MRRSPCCANDLASDAGRGRRHQRNRRLNVVVGLAGLLGAALVQLAAGPLLSGWTWHDSSRLVWAPALWRSPRSSQPSRFGARRAARADTLVPAASGHWAFASSVEPLAEPLPSACGGL